MLNIANFNFVSTGARPPPPPPSEPCQKLHKLIKKRVPNIAEYSVSKRNELRSI